MNHVSLRSRRQDQALRLGTIVGEGMELGVQAALGATHGLGGLSTCGVGPVTVHLEVRGIHHDQPSSKQPSSPKLPQSSPKQPKVAQSSPK